MSDGGAGRDGFGRAAPRRGARYAFGFPPIRALRLLLALVSSATMPQAVLLPAFAAQVLGGGPHTLAVLSAATGLGALDGALDPGSRPSVLGLGRVSVAATIVLGVGLDGFSRSGSVCPSATLLTMTGAGMMVEVAASDTPIRTMVDEDKRGRVMGSYGVAFQGAAPFGSLLGGCLAGTVGARAVVLGSGLVVLAGSPRFATEFEVRQVRPAWSSNMRQGGVMETGPRRPPSGPGRRHRRPLQPLDDPRPPLVDHPADELPRPAIGHPGGRGLQAPLARMHFERTHPQVPSLATQCPAGMSPTNSTNLRLPIKPDMARVTRDSRVPSGLADVASGPRVPSRPRRPVHFHPKLGGTRLSDDQTGSRLSRSLA